MTAALRQPAPLDELAARRLTDRIAGQLDQLHGLLRDAWRGQAWRALGYASWPAYVAAEFPLIRQLALPPAERAAIAREWRAEGASLRTIATGTGASVGAIAGDLADEPAPAELVSLDGRRRSSTGQRRLRAVPAPAPAIGRDEAVRQLVADQGAAGMTVHELTAATGLHHGQASGALSRLDHAGRLQRTSDRRERCSVYVIPLGMS